MKQHIIFTVLAATFAAVLFSSCDKKLDELAPHNVNFEERQFSSPQGFMNATVGNYQTMSAGTEYSFSTNMDYLWLNLSEFRGNNIKLVDVASTISLANSKETDAFTFSNSSSKDMGFS